MLYITTNDDRDIVLSVVKKLRENDGYCPCATEKTDDTKCPCKDFRESTEPCECHCGLYKKIEV